MSEQKSKVVKITMPYSYANEFIEESRLSFYDSRSFNIMFKDAMYKGYYDLLKHEDRKYVDEAKEEIKQFCKEMYQGINQFYKEFYEKNRRRD